jgi:hypothetical protein
MILLKFNGDSKYQVGFSSRVIEDREQVRTVLPNAHTGSAADLCGTAQPY